ncbi:MAG: hypothetical protein ABR538_05305 [Candidatus Binatia bacterium]
MTAPHRQAPSASTGTRVLLATLAVVGALVSAEIGARRFSGDAPSASPELWRAPGSALRDPSALAGAGGNLDTAMLAEDRALLWRNRPGVELAWPHIPSQADPAQRWNLRLDARGFRVGERPASPAGENPYRILCMGDSVTMGFNVDEGDDYPSVLSRLLADRFPGAAFEVINAGVPEWSWVQGAAFLRSEGFAIQPNLVVAAHGSADQGHRTTITDSERMWLGQATGEAPQGPVARLLGRSRAWQMLMRPEEARTPTAAKAASPGCRLQQAADGVCRRVSLAGIALTAHDIGEATRAAGVDLLLLNLDFSGSSSAAALRQAAVRADLLLLDYAADFRTDRLQDDMVRSRDLRLAWPHLPVVPLGRVGPPPPEVRGPRVRLRVLAPGQGRRLHVRGAGSAETGFRFEQPMNDDGIEGDERASDGVHTAVVEARSAVEWLRYRYYDGQRPEFEDPPRTAGTNSDRTVRFNRDGDAPVEDFGKRKLMSDDIHPDAEGQRRIAEAVLEKIVELPSLRRHAKPGDAAAKTDQRGAGRPR